MTLKKTVASAVLAVTPLVTGIAVTPAVASTVGAVTTTTVTRWVVANTSLNVRSGPSASYSKVGVVTGGTQLSGVITNGWMKISSGSYSGRYVSASYLTSVNPKPPTPTVTPVTRWVVPTSTLNVRSAASTTSTKVGVLAANTQVTGVITNGWMKITSGSYTGRYVITTYLTSVNPKPPTVTPVTRWVVPTSTLNVRSAASTTSTKVGVLAANTQVTGVITNGWMKITSGSYTGRYVITTYLTSVAPPPPVTGPVTMWVTPGTVLNVRAEASSTSRVIGSLFGNVQVTGVATNGWLKISSATYTGGYVPVSGLTKVDPNPSGVQVTQWVGKAGTKVRQTASLTGTVLTSYPADSQVTGVITNGWLKIAAGRDLGHYINANDLVTTQPTTPVFPSTSPTAYVEKVYPSSLTSTPEWKCEVPSGGSGLQDWPAKVRTRISKQFGITNIGGYRAAATGEHGKGRALDVMMPGVSSPVGDQIASWAAKNAKALNIYYVIWKQNIWLPSSGWTAMADRGNITQNHYDHVHISFNSGAGVCPS